MAMNSHIFVIASVLEVKSQIWSVLGVINSCETTIVVTVMISTVVVAASVVAASAD